jgi:predicted HTH transcriptional regulator
MTIQEIKSIVKKGEGRAIEFKRKVAHPEKIVREIVAFANTSGGYLLIGVDDNGTIPGLKFAEEEEYVLNNAIRKYCSPPIEFSSEIINISENRAVIKYLINESHKKPHYVIEDFETNKGKAYVRVNDRSIQASKEVREVLRRSKRDKGVKFNFGDKEKLLMEYLANNGSITLSQFQQLAGIPKYSASKTLVILVLANVLVLSPQEKEDIYYLKSFQ